MQIIMEKGKEKKKKKGSKETVTSSEMAALWPGLVAAGPCTGLGAMGLCRGRSRPQGRAETWWQPWGLQGGEHHPSESGGGPGSWLPARHLKPHPDLWEQPFWGGWEGNKSHFSGFV